MPLPPAPPLVVTDADRKQLVALSRQRSIPRGTLLRLNIALGAADGHANHLLARDLSTTVTTVLLWRKRYETDGLAGLFTDRPRSGRPKRISDKKEDAIVEATIKTVPKNATLWSLRTMATNQKVSPATVLRIWRKHKLQPHRVESFKFSNDPDFAPKVRDIVGLYMNPPDKAIVLSVDEKSQTQALDRTQPDSSVAAGLPQSGKRTTTSVTGTTTLFAALNVLEGTIMGECQPRHRHQEFLSISGSDRSDHRRQSRCSPRPRPQVKKWLAGRPRYHVHFTPTSSSWLNQVERWFAEITRKKIRRGTFRSVRDLIKEIHDYIRIYNSNPRPIQWVASASRIIRKVNKYRRTSETAG